MAILQNLIETFMSPDFFDCFAAMPQEGNEEEVAEEGVPFEANYIKLEDSVVKRLEEFPQESYIPYLLLLFSLLYEKNQDQYQGPNIEITDDTYERIFFSLQSMRQMYEIIG
jgi:hypothetical protein